MGEGTTFASRDTDLANLSINVDPTSTTFQELLTFTPDYSQTADSLLTIKVICTDTKNDIDSSHMLTINVTALSCVITPPASVVFADYQIDPVNAVTVSQTLLYSIAPAIC